MIARDIMQRVVFSASESTSAMQVAYHLMMGRMSGFPIANEDGTLIGIVTELDLIRALRMGLDLDQTPAGDLMTVNVITVDADESVERIMEILHTERIIRVPIVADGRVIGIVSRGDVLRAVLAPKAA